MTSVAHRTATDLVPAAAPGQATRFGFVSRARRARRLHCSTTTADGAGACAPGGLRFFRPPSGAGDRVRSFRAILTSDVGALGIQRAVERRGASGHYRRIPVEKPPVMGAWWQ
jgi:hypothetical protein